MIPKVIHYCWFGKGEYSKKIEKCISSWKKYCPDYEIICWNEDNYDIHKNKYVEQAYGKRKWAFVSDYARVDIVYHHGGIYLDTDVELLKPLDGLLGCEMFVGMESKDFLNFGLGFGATKRHPYLKEIMEYYETREFVRGNGKMDLKACPVIQTEILMRHGLKQEDMYQRLEKFIVYPSEVFSPKSFRTGEINITDNSISIHHFDMSWQDEKQKKNKEREWELKKRYGSKWGKLFGMIRTGPYKLIVKIKNEGVTEGFLYLKMIGKNLFARKKL
ncbi:glycosyltransferase [Lachnospiraceae bacterium JLR.KK009]